MKGAFSRLSYDLIISDVRDEDYGAYQCRIRNSEGTTMEKVTLVGKRKQKALQNHFFLTLMPVFVESQEAQPSFKFGRTICGGQDIRDIYSGGIQVSSHPLMAVLCSLMLFLMHLWSSCS
jgi:neurotrimin